MKSKQLKIVFLIDESASMHKIKLSVMEGYNEYLEILRKDSPGSITISLFKFNNEFNRVFIDKPISETKDLFYRDYIPENFSKYEDAVAKTILQTNEHLTLVDRNVKPNKVLMIIISDCESNISSELEYDSVRALISSHKKLNWNFILLCTQFDRDMLEFKNNVRICNENIKNVLQKIALSNIEYCNGSNDRYRIRKLMDELSDKDK